MRLSITVQCHSFMQLYTARFCHRPGQVEVSAVMAIAASIFGLIFAVVRGLLVPFSYFFLLIDVFKLEAFSLLT